MVQSDRHNVLHSSVLVLNRSYVALRVVSVRRAIVMLFRDAAEVIQLENGGYANYDFASWCEWSAFRDEAGNGELSGNGDGSGQAPDWLRTVRHRVLAPRVIRLLHFDQLPRLSVRLNRKSLFARDENRCQYCGREFSVSQLSFDHVTPRSRGGRTIWENVVTCCLACNSKKGDRTPREAGMDLWQRPRRPKCDPVLRLKLGNPRYQLWQPFLAANRGGIEIG